VQSSYYLLKKCVSRKNSPLQASSAALRSKSGWKVYMIAPQYGDNFQGKCGARGTYASAFTTISLPERVLYVPQLGQAVWPGVLLPQFWHLRSFGARHA